MSAATKALAQKQKRQKQFVAVGSVLLLGLVGFQLPRLMGGGGGGAGGGGAVAASPGVPGSPVTPGAAAPGAAPTTAAQPAATPGGSLPDTDRVSITPGSGQLISFGLFKSKDPFVQQLVPGDGDLSSPLTEPATTSPAPVTAAPLTPVVTTPAAAPTTPSTATPRRTAPNGGLTPVTTPTPSLSPTTVPFPSTTPVSTLPAVTPAAPTPATATAPKPTTPAPVVAPTSVLIATNGLCELVKVDGTFPGSEDIFKVIAIAKDGKSAKITVVGGAYDSGASAVTLKAGEKLTLVNTADGTRYVLQLKSQCDVQTEPVSGASTVPTATVAPPATTSSVTTPIVTDALDTTPPTG